MQIFLQVDLQVAQRQVAEGEGHQRDGRSVVRLDLALQIETLGSVREDFPNAGLLIIGSGSLEADLREQIDTKPYTGHILLCGDLDHALTLRAIAESDLLLRTTLYDGDSISVREALHLGTPVIATDNGMRPQGVHLIPVSDPAALRQAIGQQLNIPAPRREGDTDESNLQQVFDLYRELL